MAGQCVDNLQNKHAIDFAQVVEHCGKSVQILSVNGFCSERRRPGGLVPGEGTDGRGVVTIDVGDSGANVRLRYLIAARVPRNRFWRNAEPRRVLDVAQA
jgi:hypothetical protein